MNYQITPIYLGKSRTDRSTLLLRYPPGEATDITYYAFLLRGEDGEERPFLIPARRSRRLCSSRTGKAQDCRMPEATERK